MASWSAWNVTGSLNSEILRVLMSMQQNITLLQANSVLKDGNDTSSALRIGTNNNYDVVIESNNTDRMTIESTGNVRVHNQVEISGSGSAPGLCASGDNSTGLWFPTNSTAAFVGNSTNLLQVSTSDVIASGGKVSLGSGGPSLTATGPELIINGVNKDIHFHPKGSTGLMLNLSGQDLNVKTAATGTTQIQVNGLTTAARPNYSFSELNNSGMYLGTDNLVTFCQDGNNVMKLAPNGDALDMQTKQIRFNTNAARPSIAWDNVASLDTGLYSPADGILRSVNNNIDALHVSDNILAHINTHHTSENGWMTINSALPCYGSAYVFNVLYISLIRAGGSHHYYAGLMKSFATRVGNVVSVYFNVSFDGFPNPNVTDVTEIIVEVMTPNKYGGVSSYDDTLANSTTSTSTPMSSVVYQGSLNMWNGVTRQTKPFVFCTFSNTTVTPELFKFTHLQPSGSVWNNNASNPTFINGTFSYLIYQETDN